MAPGNAAVLPGALGAELALERELVARLAVVLGLFARLEVVRLLVVLVGNSVLRQQAGCC